MHLVNDGYYLGADSEEVRGCRGWGRWGRWGEGIQSNPQLTQNFIFMGSFGYIY